MSIEAKRDQIVVDILVERLHQGTLKARGKFKYTCADAQMKNSERACVLVEEVGEVCRAVLNVDGLAKDQDYMGNVEHLRAELIQVSAVALAWLEALPLKQGRLR